MTSVVTQESVQAECALWLSENWNPELSLREWRELLVDSGWAVPHWPTQWMGKGLPAWSEKVISTELHRLGAPGLPTGVGMSLAAPTILEHGTDDLKSRFLRLLSQVNFRGVSCSANQEPVQTWLGFLPKQFVMVKSGLLMVKKCGTPVLTTPTTESC